MRKRLRRGTEEAEKKTVHYRGSEQARLVPLSAEDVDGKTGAQWDIVIIEAGVSLNGRYFSPEVLQKRAAAFEGVRVFAYAFGDEYHHLPAAVRMQRPDSFPQNLVGFVDGVHYASFQKPDGRQGEGLVGRLHVTDPWWQKTYLNLVKEGGADIPGFSIDYVYESMPGTVDGQAVDVVVDIPHVYALDVVTHPAAGGRLLRAVAGLFPNEAPKNVLERGQQNMEREKLLALLKKLRGERGLEGVDIGKATDQELWSLLEQAVADWAKEHGKEEEDPAMKGLLSVVSLLKEGKKDEAKAEFEKLAPQFGVGRESKPAAPAEPEKKQEPAVSPEATRAVEELLEKLKIREAQFQLKERLAEEDKLPKAAKEQIEARFRGRAFEESELEAAIREYKDFLAKIDPTGQVVGLGSQAKDVRVQLGREEADKLQAAMDLLLGYEPDESERRAYEGIKPFRGLLEAYSRITGDAEVRGFIDRDRLLRGAEAKSSDFPNTLSTSMHKRMVREYRRLAANWRPLVDVRSLTNFKTHDAIRWGGFSNLSVVAEDPDTGYPYLTKPSEEKASYAASKRGALFYVTREMIKNDDLGAVRKIPLKIAQAANRTLAQFVFDLLINYGGSPTPSVNGGTIYDTKALYHADHANILTDALDFDAFGKARTMMRKQKEAGSNEVLGLQPAFLVVPIDLENTAEIILQSERRPGVMDNDVNIFRNRAQLIVSPFLRDDNNWYLVASPQDTETIEIGFIDGREEPELLLQDQPTVGEVFTHDRITWKVRHEYGGAVVDYRGFVGAIVP